MCCCAGVLLCCCNVILLYCHPQLFKTTQWIFQRNFHNHFPFSLAIIHNRFSIQELIFSTLSPPTTLIAVRTWMCGGKVKTVTCSHVGHVFKEFPYSFDGDKETIVQKNLMRVAETWMGGMKKYFYASTFVYPFKKTRFSRSEEASLAERKRLRKRLRCQNFEWYLYNVIPQMLEPPMQAVLYGELTNENSRWSGSCVVVGCVMVGCVMVGCVGLVVWWLVVWWLVVWWLVLWWLVLWWLVVRGWL